MSQKSITPHLVSRFAPSPTGRLHVGHGFSALLAHDLARSANGRFLLRIEDTDVTRCRAEFTDALCEDLQWLGIAWDGILIQSERLAVYDAALERLKGTGLVYPCFCSRADIAREVAASLHAPHGADGPLYPGTCRGLSADERMARIAAGEPHSWRLDMGAALDRTGPLSWHDETVGDVAVDPDALGDLILKGRDRPASYHLAVVVDDAAQGVTDVVRGRDVFASTHAHRMLQALLGPPRAALSPSCSGRGCRGQATRQAGGGAQPRRTARGRLGRARAGRRAARRGAFRLASPWRTPRSALQETPMANGFLIILLIAAVIGAVAYLVRGIVTFLRTTEEDLKSGTSGPSQSSLKQNKMMMGRVTMQAAAIFIIALLLLMHNSK